MPSAVSASHSSSPESSMDPAPTLARLDQSLECPICKLSFAAPVSLPCGHSFCSRCVRDALQERKECPICREDAREGQVRRNRVIEEVVGLWTGIRDDIFRAYHESQVASRKRSTDSPSTTTTSRKRRRGSPTQIEQKAKTRSTNGNGVGDEPIILDIDASSDVEHASRSSDDEVHALSVPPMQSTGPSIVTCPACTQQVLLTSLNLHLDRGCPPAKPNATNPTQKASWAALFSSTGGNSTGTSADDAELQSKRISKPNYALVSPRDLRALLETYGCSTVGERQTLVERVQLWISLFNANLDASHPRSLKSLRAELDSQERGKNRDKDDAARAKQAFVNAKQDDEAFKRLERELKARRKDKGDRNGR